ncbi:glycosyltransferase [Kineococcus auxinigenes]|uniref:glycosyltransferase n=1 Tax=unclassified Kineococcus TaxID=2621656 RepID=UPI003D7E131C
MSRRRTLGTGPDVFLNVTALTDNPYPGLWTGAVRAAGGQIRPFGVRPLLRGRLRGRGWVDLQWPEWVFRGSGSATGKLLMLLRTCLVARLLGHRLVLTVHNLRGHGGEHPHLERAMWAALTVLATHVHTFTEAGAREFRAAHPAARRARDVVIPHGHYGPVLGELPDRRVARAALGLGEDDEVVLTFGKLSAYKGVNALVRAFTGDPSPAARLLVCGAPADSATVDFLQHAAGADDRLRVTARFLQENELTAAVVAADLVVLPYARVTNSGSALMALSIGRPVLLPDTPVFAELRERTGTAWVHLYRGGLNAVALRAALSAAREVRDEVPDLDWCSWSTVEAQLRSLFSTGVLTGLPGGPTGSRLTVQPTPNRARGSGCGEVRSTRGACGGGPGQP